MHNITVHFEGVRRLEYHTSIDEDPEPLFDTWTVDRFCKSSTRIITSEADIVLFFIDRLNDFYLARFANSPCTVYYISLLSQRNETLTILKMIAIAKMLCQLLTDCSSQGILCAEYLWHSFFNPLHLSQLLFGLVFHVWYIQDTDTADFLIILV